jgi:hypothetical protein
MTGWTDPGASFFNPRPTLSVVPLPGGSPCVVLDDVLSDPERLRRWAGMRSFGAPMGYPYPGVVLEAPPDLTQRVADHFAQHVRGRLGARRTLGLTVRMSLITTPPQALAPVQWQCHRDRLAVDRSSILFAASVLYLFRDPALGGTSFYRPRIGAAEVERLVADSAAMDAATFGARYGLEPGYMSGSNAYFERVAQVPAAWNRMIAYDGSLFHSADVDPSSGLSADPTRGRLTLNSFVTCRRAAA